MHLFREPSRRLGRLWNERDGRDGAQESNCFASVHCTCSREGDFPNVGRGPEHVQPMAGL
jgi:hypothetical protein